MPKSFFACLSAVLVLVMLAFAYGEADAARIGGGRSFGGRPSMSQPYTKPLPSNPSSSFSQQTNRQSQQAAAAASPAGRGLFGGMGGMLGGLLAGSLLGSLLFGGGFNGGGFLDIILIGVILFIAGPRRRARASPTRATSIPSAVSPHPTPCSSAPRRPRATRADSTGTP